MIELRIGGRAVDISPDTQITLEFKSNLFGDITEITASNSMTINIPKTPTNNQVFGMPAAIGGRSSAPYRKWEAELYVNGVKIVDAAYAVLLSVGTAYEIMLYWGVAKALSTLKDNDKNINELNEVLSIKYGGTTWWDGWEGKMGQDQNGNVNANLINALYDSGISSLASDITARSQYALLPSARVKWVWDTILKEAGLAVTTPQTFQRLLNRLVIPFTTHKTTTGEQTAIEFTKANIRGNGSLGIGVTFHTPANKIADSLYFTTSTTEVKIQMQKRELSFDSFVYTALADHSATFNIAIEGKKEWDDKYYQGFLYIAKYSESNSPVVVGKELLLTTSDSFSVEMSKEVALTKGERAYVYIYVPATQRYASISINKATMDIQRKEDGDQIMGGMINTRDNLPGISQVDFIKDISAMGGLWPTLIGGNVYLVDYADFYNGNQPTLDWSHKLIGTSDDDAQNTTYTLEDFAQRNLLKYSDDATDKVEANGILYLENNNIEEENELIELPFAASKGNVIPHLAYKDETNDDGTREIEEIDIEPRIMKLNESISIDGRKASLTFDGLSWSDLIASNYPFWQRIMRNPIVITEKIWLSEIEIKELDYRKPIYLQKYGARFAVQQVQWSEGEPSSVTLVYLPPMNDIAVALPYNVTTGVAYVEVGAGEVVGVDPIPSLSYLVSGKGEYFAESATIRFDDTAGAMYNLKFVRWASPAGRTISTENPYIYDGTNGDLEIIALTEQGFVKG